MCVRARSHSRTQTRALEIFLSHVYFRIIFWLFKYIYNNTRVYYTIMYLWRATEITTNKSQELFQRTLHLLRQRQRWDKRCKMSSYFTVPFDSWVLKCYVNIEFLCDHLPSPQLLVHANDALHVIFSQQSYISAMSLSPSFSLSTAQRWREEGEQMFQIQQQTYYYN